MPAETETVLEVARAVLRHNTDRGEVPTGGEPLWWWNRLVHAEADGSEQECTVVLSHCLRKCDAALAAGRYSGRSEDLVALIERIRAALGEESAGES